MLSEIADEVASELGDIGIGRMLGDAEDVHDPRLELDDEKNIELGEVDGVHGEEVRRQDSLGLRGEELLPARSTSKRWSNTVTSKNTPDRSCRGANPETTQLTLDADTAPAPVLATKAKYELDGLVGKRWSTRSSFRSPPSPPALGELSMPSQQCLGCDEERSPSRPGKKAAERRENRAVTSSIANAPANLTLQDADLVAKHHELDVAVHIRAPKRAEETKQTA